ncbi:MAG TPA: hypothetical protein VNP04_12460 [Alphaproteobacteria bacterium]|nr:hypothetical protein [Alphaproteobacteria bacterium]
MPTRAGLLCVIYAAEGEPPKAAIPWRRWRAIGGHAFTTVAGVREEDVAEADRGLRLHLGGHSHRGRLRRPPSRRARSNDKDFVIDGREDDCLPPGDYCSMQIEAEEISLINVRLASTLEAGRKSP